MFVVIGSPARDSRVCCSSSSIAAWPAPEAACTTTYYHFYDNLWFYFWKNHRATYHRAHDLRYEAYSEQIVVLSTNLQSKDTRVIRFLTTESCLYWQTGIEVKSLGHWSICELHSLHIASNMLIFEYASFRYQLHNARPTHYKLDGSWEAENSITELNYWGSMAY